MFVQTRASHHREGFQLATVFAFAVAVISPIQSTLGGFLPKRAALVVSGVALVVALVSQALQALERRREARAARERRLASLLVEWPLPRVEEADPYVLGVLHASLPADRMPYIPRDLDAAVSEAVRTEPFVLLTGPVMAGKSRLALEATRRAMPGARLIVPRTPSALLALSELEHPLEIDDAGAVLWLDDLDVYLQAAALDVKALEALEKSTPRVVVVATLDESRREQLLREEGHVGRLSRMVLGRAAHFAVPPVLSEAEQRSASRLYDRPISGTVGANFAAEAAVPAGGRAQVGTAEAPRAPARIPDIATPAPAPAMPLPDAPEAAPARAGGRGSRLVKAGWLFAALALLVPATAFPAVVCGVLASRRGRRMAGAAIVATSLVLALAGASLWAADPWTSPPVAGAQVLDRYFGDRFARCQQGLTPEFPDCGRILDAQSQQQWLQLHGYPACLAQGNAAGVCVRLLP